MLPLAYEEVYNLVIGECFLPIMHIYFEEIRPKWGPCNDETKSAMLTGSASSFV